MHAGDRIFQIVGIYWEVSQKLNNFNDTLRTAVSLTFRNDEHHNWFSLNLKEIVASKKDV